MATGTHRGGDFYGAATYRSREGLSTRPVTGSDEIQLRIDPMHADLDDEITGLRKQVRQLRNVAQEIESEAKFQNDFINQLAQLVPANDIDQSSSRCEEQYEETEQEYRSAGSKQCYTCGSFCAILFFCGLLTIQIFKTMRTSDLAMHCSLLNEGQKTLWDL